MGVLRATELLITAFSRDGRLPVLDHTRLAWAAELEGQAGAIREELLPLLRRREDIPNFQDVSEPQRVLTQDSGWKTFFLFITGKPIAANCDRCPRTAAAVRRVPGMQNALFSILAPGKHIPEHRGVYKGLLRYHLALVVPREREKVRINVAYRPYTWTEGRGFLFDDTFPHEVWNDTDEERVVLMVDLVRPLAIPLRELNAFVLRVLSKTSIARKPLEKLNRRADAEPPRP
jgi:beta-hydroxylase